MRIPLSFPILALSLLGPLLAPVSAVAQNPTVTVPPITATETTKATTQGISETTSSATTQPQPQPQPDTSQPKK